MPSIRYFRDRNAYFTIAKCEDKGDDFVAITIARPSDTSMENEFGYFYRCITKNDVPIIVSWLLNPETPYGIVTVVEITKEDLSPSEIYALSIVPHNLIIEP